MKRIGIYVCAVLSGCAATYTPPPAESYATLKIEQVNLNGFFIYLNGEDCSNKTIVGEQVLSGAKSIKIAANREIGFHLETNGYYPGSGYKFCSQKTSFLPRDNESYILKYAGNENKCTAELVRLEIRDGETIEVQENSFHQRKPRTPVMESGSFCKAKKI